MTVVPARPAATGAILIILSLMVIPGEVFAWGSEGHRLVCAIAERSLSARGEAFLREVSGDGRYLPGGELPFAESCLWPDKVKYGSRKGSFDDHFINVPADATGLDIRRDCSAFRCLPVAIQRSMVYLSGSPESKRGKGRRAAALRFLGHYIGDLHQPLHVSHGEDLGGNRIRVTWFEQTSNLHSVWDQDMMRKAGLSWPESLEMLMQEDTKPGDPDIPAWLNGSLRLARERAYLHPDGKPVRSGDHLGEEYLAANLPVVIREISLAGKRLGAIIDRIAEGASLSFMTPAWQPLPYVSGERSAPAR